MMKEKYTQPIIEIIKFQEEDIITTSSLGNLNQGGDKNIGWGDF